MKSALFILALVLTTSAHAMSVGDSATYHVVSNGVQVDVTSTVTAIDGDTYTATASATAMGQTSQQVTTGSVAQAEQMNAAFSNCANYGGAYESLTTAAGTFNTCHVATDTGAQVYISPEVTFGIVKTTLSNSGNELTMELTAFVKK